MKEWIVEIEGSPKALTFLSKQFNGPECTIFERDNSFFLKSSVFQKYSFPTEADKVQSTANMAILPTLNDIALIQDGQIGQVKANHVTTIDNGIITSGGFVSLNAQGRLRMYAPEIIWPPTVTLQPQETYKWFVLSMKSDKVNDALHFWGLFAPNLTDPWWNLYKVYDIIVNDIKDGRKTLVSNGWATWDELEKFRVSANNRSVHRDLARHGTREIYTVQPFTVEEGAFFVKELLTKWLNSIRVSSNFQWCL